MKGAKGGKRDSIISRLFSFKNKKVKEVLESENIEIQKQNQKKEITKENNYTANINNQITENEQQEIIKEINLENISNVDIEQEKKQITDTPTLPQEQTLDTTINETPESKVQTTVETTETITDVTVSEPVIEEKEIFIESDDEFESILECAAFNELEKMIKEDYYEIQEIKYELEILQQKEEEEVVLDEVEKLQKQLEKLIRQFEEIKKRYDYIYSTLNFDQVNNIQDSYISDKITEYKENAQVNTQIEEFVDEIKSINEYISIIDTIIRIEKDKDELNDNIDEKLDKFQIRDEEFEEMKDSYSKIEEINDTLYNFNKKQDSIIKDLESKVNTSAKIETKIETATRLVPNFNKLFKAVLLVAVSKKIPPTRKGNILKAGLLIGAVSAASHFVQKKEETKKITTVKYTDYGKDIRNSITSINDVIYNIDNAFLDIKDLKATFKNEFEEYRQSIPEYDEMLKNIDNIEKELKIKQDLAFKYNKDFTKILHENNVKVKRIEENN